MKKNVISIYSWKSYKLYIQVVFCIIFNFYSVKSLCTADENINFAKLHMIIIGELSDKNIGAIRDYPRMQIEAEKISRLVGLELVPYYFEKETLTPKKLVSQISS